MSRIQPVGRTLPRRYDERVAALDAILRYHYQQGLTTRRFTCEDVFVDNLLET